MSTIHWQPLSDADLEAVMAIAGVVHPDLPERPEVFAEKLHLFPAGCFKLVTEGRTLGYALSHPWRCAGPPPLDSFLTRLPANADALFIHDVALLAEARGRGAGRAFIRLAEQVAGSLPAMTLVAAYGTARIWQRFGFVPIELCSLGATLTAYGDDAVYMLRARQAHAATTA